jgi:hypothetical protein
MTPAPLPGGSALGGLFKLGRLLSPAAKLFRSALKVRPALPILQRLCFIAGTPILTAEGLKPIEEIEEGDKVLSYNEKTKQTEYKTVVQTMVRKAEAGRIWSVKVEGEAEVLGVTGEHPFYVRIHRARDNTASEDDDEGDWREAKNLQIGDEIRTAQGGWAKVKSVTQRSAGAKVYNFEVADNHNYFVGRTNLLAHNADCFKIVSKIGNHPTLVKAAETAGTSVQRGIDSLTSQLAKGNLNPGIGSKHLFKDIYYARARDGARVFFRQVGNTVEVVAKASKHNEQQVINALKSIY